MSVPTRAITKFPDFTIARVEKGFTRYELSEAAGVNRCLCSKAEAGQPVLIDTALKLSRALDMNLEELFDFI